MSRTTFSLLKIPILSHKPLRTGVQPKYKHFKKTLLFCDCRAIYSTKTKTAGKVSQSFGPVKFYTRRILYPRYFSSVARTPRKVTRRMTSDFDVCEADLGMQMSFVNAAPYNERPVMSMSEGRER